MYIGEFEAYTDYPSLWTVIVDVAVEFRGRDRVADVMSDTRHMYTPLRDVSSGLNSSETE